MKKLIVQPLYMGITLGMDYKLHPTIEITLEDRMVVPLNYCYTQDRPTQEAVST